MNPSGSLNPSPRTLEVDSIARFDRLVGAGAQGDARLARAVA
jgi:hypothetical protein